MTKMGEVLELAKRVDALIESGLQLRGFHRDRSKMLVTEVSADVIGVVALGRATYRDRFELSPKIHLRHRGMDALLCRALGVKVAAPAIAANIGYVTSAATYMVWTFDVDGRADVMKEVDDVLRTIDESAVPFMRRHATLESMWDTVSSRGLCAAPQYVIPVFHVLLGRREEAIAAISQELARRHGSAALSVYEQFAANLLGSP